MSKLRISVVIPVYNEAATIGPCLEALLAQEVPPDEIIVVDNNSTDETPQLLRQFAPHITLLTEAKQGVFFARNTGFDAAKGDIIGRIDADTRVTSDWVAQLRRIFQEDQRVSAVTGPLSYYDMPLKRIGLELDTFFRRSLKYFLKDYKFLQGANMALTAEAWRAIRTQVCHDARVHEDIDIAIHLGLLGRRVVFDPELIASVSSRRVEDDRDDFNHYLEMLPKSYELHNVPGKHSAQALSRFLFINRVPLKVIHRLYDPQRNMLSIRKFLKATHTHRPL